MPFRVGEHSSLVTWWSDQTVETDMEAGIRVRPAPCRSAGLLGPVLTDQQHVAQLAIHRREQQLEGDMMIQLIIVRHASKNLQCSFILRLLQFSVGQFGLYALESAQERAAVRFNLSINVTELF